MSIKNFLNLISVQLFRFYHFVLVGLRYKLTIIGGEKIHDNINPNRGILFLSNHPSHLDGTFLTIAIREQNSSASIWTLDYVYKNPYTRLAARNPETVTLMKVPNIYESRKKSHDKKLRKLINRSVEVLRQGRNILFFPSGSQKHQAYEVIHGKSAVHRILQQIPDVNIVVVKITGMWGSRFSKAVKKEERSLAKGDNILKFVWNIVKVILLNFIFFIPRRNVTIEFLPVGEDFPRHGTRQEINSYLEKQINSGFVPEGEPILQVSNYFWKTSYTPIEYHLKQYTFNEKDVPHSVIHDIKSILSKVTKINPEKINLDMHLERDLSIDSLEATEILMEIEKKYHLPEMLPKHLDTVGHLAAIASGATIDYQLVEGKKLNVHQEVIWPVRTYRAFHQYIYSLFGFRENPR